MKSIRSVFILGLIIFTICSRGIFPQSDNLRIKISSIIKQAKGHIGVAIFGSENHDTLTINNNYKYPMQSVYKFPLALYVLHKVDKGDLSLDQKII